MSPHALARRREEMRQLYRLMMYLRRARPLGPVNRNEPTPPDDSGPDKLPDR